MSDLVGLIPAAGRGVRAYPYTATIPKSMLEVDGIPVLQRNVELMRDALGIRALWIVVGYRGHVIERHFGTGAHLGMQITYIHNPRVDLELPYSVYLAGQQIAQPCCMILADECYVGSNHAALLTRRDATALVTCGVMRSESAAQFRKNYLVTVRDGMVVDLIEKPTSPGDGLMGTGTYVLHPELFARLAAAYGGDPEHGPRDWTSWLATQARSGSRILPFELTGKYVNINSRDDLNYANYLVRNYRFAEQRTSLVYVVDADDPTVARSIERFARLPEVDEVVVVARRPLAVESRAAPGKIRAVAPADPGIPVGDLLKFGLNQASGSILLLTYNDDTFDPRDVAKILVYLRDADMVVGTRTTRQMIEQGGNMRGVVRASHILLAKLLQILWWRFDSRFTDVCCVFRGMWRSTYETIRDNMTADGAEVYPEMIIEVLRARRRIIEIPINYYNRDLEHPYVRSPYQTINTFRRIIQLMVRKRWRDSVVSRWAAGREDG